MPQKTATQKPGAAWEKRRLANSMQIEKAALQLFIEHGFENVTVEDIAAAAGISRRTFYRYFDTTTDVLTAMPRRLSRVVDAVRARPSSEPLLQSLKAATRAARISDEEIEIQKLGARVMQRSPEVWSRAIAMMHPSAAEIYEEIIADRLRARGLDTSPAPIAAAGLSAMIVQICRQNAREGGVFEAEKLEAALQAFIDVVEPKLTARRPKRP